MRLLTELRIPKKGVINIQNKDQKIFWQCHVRHINPVKVHPEIITQEDKELVEELGYDRIEFPV